VTPQDRSAMIEEAAHRVVAAMDMNGYVAPGFASDLDLRAALAVVAEETTPPAEKGCPACGGGGAFYDRDHHKCVACGAIGGTGRSRP
jgi:hypothetical protein